MGGSTPPLHPQSPESGHMATRLEVQESSFWQTGSMGVQQGGPSLAQVTTGASERAAPERGPQRPSVGTGKEAAAEPTSQLGRGGRAAHTSGPPRSQGDCPVLRDATLNLRVHSHTTPCPQPRREHLPRVPTDRAGAGFGQGPRRDPWAVVTGGILGSLLETVQPGPSPNTE